jgi:PPOX class probable F420-dependent enzyme
MSVLPDPATPFGERVARRLRDEIVIWYISVGRHGTPQPNPVWFWWDGEAFIVYNRPDAARVVDVAARPRVALHFDGNGRGGDIVVFTGTAKAAPDLPPPHAHPQYLGKYRESISRVSGSPEAFSQQYSVPIRVYPDRVRGF